MSEPWPLSAAVKAALAALPGPRGRGLAGMRRPRRAVRRCVPRPRHTTLGRVPFPPRAELEGGGQGPRHHWGTSSPPTLIEWPRWGALGRGEMLVARYSLARYQGLESQSLAFGRNFKVNIKPYDLTLQKRKLGRRGLQFRGREFSAVVAETNLKLWPPGSGLRAGPCATWKGKDTEMGTEGSF